MNKDYTIRGTACKDQFRWFASVTTNTVQTARDLHDLSPLSTILLGRMLSAAVMLSWDLKNPDSELTLQVIGDGDLQGAMVVCTAQGTLKGYVKNPQLWLENTQDNFSVGKALGNGIISIFRSEPGKQPYTGTSKLISGEIAEDIAHYFQQSEQIPTAVNLGILIDQHAVVRSSGGFIIQQMPFADLRDTEKLEENLAKTPNLSDLMDMGLSITDIFNRFVFNDLDWCITDQKTICYECNCSRKRFAKALLLLGKSELESMQEGIKPICHFCNKEYIFTASDMQALINELNSSKKDR